MKNYRDNLSLEKKISIKNDNTLAKAKYRSILNNKSNEKYKDITKSKFQKQEFTKNKLHLHKTDGTQLLNKNNKKRTLTEKNFDNNYTFNEIKINIDNSLSKLNILYCTICNNSKLSQHQSSNISNYRCSSCIGKSNSKSKNYNYFQLHGPSKMPDDLKAYPLSFVEEQLIALVYVNQFVYHRNRTVIASKGHCINFAQDISSIATELPRLESDLPIIIVKKTNSNFITYELKIRRFYVQVWLEFLISRSNIPGYAKLKNINKDNLTLLPENGYFTKYKTIDEANVNIIKTTIDKRAIIKEMTDNNYDDSMETETDSDSENNTINTGVYMPKDQQLTEKSKIGVFVQELVNDNLNFPNHSEQPLNDYSTPFLCSMAFPTLFPDGSGDPYAIHAEMNKESFLSKVKHLLNYYEKIGDKIISRFAKHSRFVLWIYNVYTRHSTNDVGTFYLQNNPEQASMSIENLKQLIKVDKNSVINTIQRYMANIRGSSSYWYQTSKDLKCIIKYKGPPHSFFTLSYPTHFEPYLHELLGIPKGSSYNTIDKYLKDNPQIVNEYFIKKFEIFQKEWLEKRMHGRPELGGWVWSRFEWQHRDAIHVHGLIRFGNNAFDPYTTSKICIEGHKLTLKAKEKTLTNIENDIIQKGNYLFYKFLFKSVV